MDIILNAVQFLLDMGGSIILPFFVTILGIIFGLKFVDSFKNGLMIGVGFAGINLMVNLLVTTVQPSTDYYTKLGTGFTTVNLGSVSYTHLAYFQAYTNTYAPTDYLRKIYTEALSHPDIVALSIATRPDCLDKEVLDLLEELNNIKPIWIELGLQTINEKTAKYIRRGYTLSCFDSVVKELRKRGRCV